MKKRTDVIPVFGGFFLLSLLIFFFLHKPIAGFLQHITVPIQRTVFGSIHKRSVNKSEVEQLKDENNRLSAELAKQKEVEKENKALRDQFQTTAISSQKLLPAKIVGMENDVIIIDKGEQEGVKVGNPIVVKNNLIGRVAKLSPHVSIVYGISHTDTSLTAKTLKTGVTGIIKGTGSVLILDNVVLSDKLEKGDTVVTKGDVDASGRGFPPSLVIGKITSVNKRASALFQVAEVKSLVDISKLETVFIITGN